MVFPSKEVSTKVKDQSLEKTTDQEKEDEHNLFEQKIIYFMFGLKRSDCLTQILVRNVKPFKSYFQLNICASQPKEISYLGNYHWTA